MEFQPLLSSAPRYSPLLFWAGCGTALVSLGVWFSASTASATNAHVRVQPKLDMQVGMLSTQRQGSRDVLMGQRGAQSSSSTTARAAAAAPVAAAAAAGAAGGPWLSILQKTEPPLL